MMMMCEDKVRSKDWNLLPGHRHQVVIQGEEEHVVEEEAGGRQEVPDVVVVVEPEELTLGVHVPRLGRGHDPVGGGRHVEGQGPDPGYQGDTEVEQRLSGDPLPIPQLHQDVVAGVEQQVADQHL